MKERERESRNSAPGKAYGTSTTLSGEGRGSIWSSPSSLKGTRANNSLAGGEAATGLPDLTATTGVVEAAAGGFEPKIHGSAGVDGGSNSPEGTDPSSPREEVVATGEWSRAGEWGPPDRKSTRLNSSHSGESRMPSSA